MSKERKHGFDKATVLPRVYWDKIQFESASVIATSIFLHKLCDNFGIIRGFNYRFCADEIGFCKDSVYKAIDRLLELDLVCKDSCNNIMLLNYRDNLDSYIYLPSILTIPSFLKSGVSTMRLTLGVLNATPKDPKGKRELLVKTVLSKILRNPEIGRPSLIKKLIENDSIKNIFKAINFLGNKLIFNLNNIVDEAKRPYTVMIQAMFKRIRFKAYTDSDLKDLTSVMYQEQQRIGHLENFWKALSITCEYCKAGRIQKSLGAYLQGVLKDYNSGFHPYAI